MAPRKKTWAQFKASGVRRMGLPGSAFSQIQNDNYNVQSNRVAAALREEAERKASDVGDLEKGKKQVRAQQDKKKSERKDAKQDESKDAVTKAKPVKDSIPAVPAVKKKGKATAMKARKPTGITKTSKDKHVKRIRRARKDSFIECDDEGESSKPTHRARRSRIIADDDADDDNADDSNEPLAATESWRPYGGENCIPPEVPTVYLGIARIPEFRLDDFKAALYERLEEGYGIKNKPEIATKACDEGGEVFVDIGARFGDEEIAEQIATDLDGEKLMGRKLRIAFAEPW